MRGIRLFFSKDVAVSRLIAGMERATDRKWFTGLKFSDNNLTCRFTAVEPITFRNACKAIAQYAFVTSDLPVIISLEVHCNLEQQKKMVDVPPSSFVRFWKRSLGTCC